MGDVKDDGGPAFGPIVILTTEANTEQTKRAMSEISRTSVTLRDWFAGQAMGAKLASLDSGAEIWHENGSYRTISKRAYEIADAMIAARKEST